MSRKIEPKAANMIMDIGSFDLLDCMKGQLKVTLTTFMTLLDSHACRDRQASATDLQFTLLFIIKLALTHNMAMIQPSFISSK